MLDDSIQQQQKGSGLACPIQAAKALDEARLAEVLLARFYPRAIRIRQYVRTGAIGPKLLSQRLYVLGHTPQAVLKRLQYLPD